MATLPVSKVAAPSILSKVSSVASTLGNLGQAFSAFGGGDKAARKENRRAIFYRVKDAQAAGVHPLFALGASLPGASGSSGSGIGDALSALGRAGEAHQQGRMARETHAAALAQSRAATNRDEAQALYYLSAAKRAEQSVNSQPNGQGLVNAVDATTGQSVVVPAEVTAASESSPATVAGPPSPGSRNVQFHARGPVRRVPDPAVGDSELPGIIGAWDNWYYGNELDRIVDLVGNISPYRLLMRRRRAQTAERLNQDTAPGEARGRREAEYRRMMRTRNRVRRGAQPGSRERTQFNRRRRY